MMKTGSLQYDYESSIRLSTGIFYISSSGEEKYFLLKKVRDENDKYFRLEAEARGAIYQCQYLRKYIQMLDPGSSQTNTYIFHYVDGITVEKRIQNMANDKKSIPIQEIQRYMYQLMNALYVLHQNNMLGRVFTTSNILITNNLQNIVMMDFGFLSSNRINIAAPEVQNPQPIDLKSDVWLFGAFIFHLMKLKSIRQNSTINLNTSQFDQSGGEVQSCGTNRYESEFCQLVDEMLQTNKDQRISFYEILQSKYFQQCPKINEMKEFYKNSGQIDKQILKNMELSFDDLDTGKLDQLENYPEKQQQQLKVRISSDINSFLPPQNQEQIQYISPTINPQSSIFFPPQNLSEVEDCSQYFEYIPQQVSINDQFYYLWNYINLEQFRLFILKETATRISQYDNVYTKYGRYVITKLRILLMDKFCQQMKESNYGSPLQQDLLIRFKQTNQCKELEHKFMSASIQLKNDLKSSNRDLQTLCQDDSIGRLILESLIKDENENFKFTQTEEDFKMKGYRQVVAKVFMVITDMRERAADQEKSQLLKLILQVLLCHLYNRLFEVRDLQEHYAILQIHDVNYQIIYNFIHKAQFTDQQRIQFINSTKMKYFSQ